MPKRHHSDDVESAESPKRRKKKTLDAPAATQLLLEHADQLIECLNSLKSTNKLDTANASRLASLSASIIPALRGIRHGLDEEEAGEVSKDDGGSTTRQPPDTATSASTVPSRLLPPFRGLTEWTVPEIPEQHPPLPPISDSVLEKAAFSHEGTRLRRSDLSYERLEFVGDAFIYHLASEFLAQTFPRYTPGQCTQMRERLLCNANLSEYALHYGFETRAILPREFHADGRRGSGGTVATAKERQKVLGDIFEAYIGALVRSGPDGEERATGWLKALWSMKIATEIRAEYHQRTAADDGVDRDKLAKDRLSELIGCPGVKIHYEDIPSNKRKLDKNNHLPLFFVGVFVDGWGKTNEQLGVGSGLSKKDAREMAAAKAMENKKLFKFYADKKKAYLEARNL